MQTITMASQSTNYLIYNLIHYNHHYVLVVLRRNLSWLMPVPLPSNVYLQITCQIIQKTQNTRQKVISFISNSNSISLTGMSVSLLLDGTVSTKICFIHSNLHWYSLIYYQWKCKKNDFFSFYNKFNNNNNNK